MTDAPITTIYDHGPEAPESMVILLHGLGSNGQDLISLAPLWAKELPNTLFLSPDAPFACDMVPPGYPNSYQWFSLQDRDPHVMLQGVEAAAPILDDFITQQLENYSLSADKLALCGFSQGTMMSLYVGPRYKDKIAGVLGYSGAMIGEGGEHKIPVHLVHGEADDVVPVEAYHHAKETLEKNGHAVSGHTTAYLQHSINQDGLDSGGNFLKSILK
ncbi:MAG: dienelactone hydrolase family protein [Pseudomonadota bacterium]